jgi:colicin import membrane protein
MKKPSLHENQKEPSIGFLGVFFTVDFMAKRRFLIFSVIFHVAIFLVLLFFVLEKPPVLTASFTPPPSAPIIEASMVSEPSPVSEKVLQPEVKPEVKPVEKPIEKPVEKPVEKIIEQPVLSPKELKPDIQVPKPPKINKPKPVSPKMVKLDKPKVQQPKKAEKPKVEKPIQKLVPKSLQKVDEKPKLPAKTVVKSVPPKDSKDSKALKEVKDAKNQKNQKDQKDQKQLLAELKQQEALAAAAAEQRALTIEQKYMGLIQASIRAEWINQFDPLANLQVTLVIQLDPKGKVESVEVSQSSGNAAFDRQAMAAVQKASPLPIPDDPSIAKDFAEITLPFSNQQ